MAKWGSPSELETNKRIKLLLFAYAYEFQSDSLVSDEEFDALAKTVNLNTPTSRPDLDVWFKKNFHPDTGQWITSFPELDKLGELYSDFKKYCWLRKKVDEFWDIL